MKYSIVVATFNRPNSITNCLHAIATSILKGKRKPTYELIVVNDGRVGVPEQIAEELRGKGTSIRVIGSSQLGPGGARNVGLDNTKGEIVVFLDDDTLVTVDWFSKLDCIFEDGSVVAAGGSLENLDKSYIGVSSHLLNFSSWLHGGKNRIVRDIPLSHAAYRKNAIRKMRFLKFAHRETYEDALFNHELKKKGHCIWFFPNLRAKHGDDNMTFGKFFYLQERMARGFVKGHRVHGKLGSILFHVPILMLFCPRLLFVGLRCLRAGRIAEFLWCFPLIFCGEFYRGAIICRERMKY